ncbi:unnamed protein product [Prorocentrum cordatum]|uniref:RRM domain-containing protein n=1 Tax=Prorocentrum cordatum TaxID=2364126 RepID=A0ABN9W226_9DINO|nr:unnamed protein product [Polarella glacialis]
MGHHLRVLEAQDVQCVFVVRRIHTLAMSSPEILASHYAAFGQIMEVLVPHSRVKHRFSRHCCGQLRTRPGSIGFVVMADARAVEAVLRAGREQTVAGKRIIVEPFKSAPAKPQQKRSGSSTPPASTSAGPGEPALEL